MDENLMGKIQEVLSDPESMQQISELAKMLQGDSAGTASQCGDTAALGGGAPMEAPVSETPPALPLGGIDPAMLLKMGELLRNTNDSDKNTALLMALRPHVGEQRQQRIDKALRLMKLWVVFQTMQKTGMLQQLF